MKTSVMRAIKKYIVRVPEERLHRTVPISQGFILLLSGVCVLSERVGHMLLVKKPLRDS